MPQNALVNRWGLPELIASVTTNPLTAFRLEPLLLKQYFQGQEHRFKPPNRAILKNFFVDYKYLPWSDPMPSNAKAMPKCQNNEPIVNVHQTIPRITNSFLIKPPWRFHVLKSPARLYCTLCNVSFGTIVSLRSVIEQIWAVFL